jgi:hypothetical protein
MERINHLKSLVIKDQEVYFLVIALFGYILAYIDPYSSKGFPQYINFFIRGILLIFSIYFIIRNFAIIKKRKFVIGSFLAFFLFYLFKLYQTIPSINLPADPFLTLKNSIYYFGFVIIPLPVVVLLSLDYQKVSFKKFLNIIFWSLLIIFGVNFLYTNFIFESYTSNGRSGIFRSYYILVGHYGLSMVIISLYNYLFLENKGYVYVLGILLGLFPIYVSAARSPVLALLLILFIFLILINKRKYWIYFFVILFISFLILFIIYKSGMADNLIFFKRINAAIFERNASGRSYYLNKGIGTFFSHPVFGGNALFPDGMYSHNLFVDILMSTGLLGMVLFIIYFKFVAQSFFKILKHIDRYKEGGIIAFFFLQYFILAQTSGNLYSSFECWYFGAAVIGLGYINFTNEEIKSNDSRGNATGNH